MFSSSKLFSFVVVLFLVKVKSAFGASADKYFTICRRSSSDFEKCIERTIMAAKPNLVKGIPEIGLPPLDPMAFSPLNFKESNRHFKLQVKYTDVFTEGFSKLVVKNAKVSGDVDKGLTINLTITGPYFYTYGKWAGKGRALQFNVNGNGVLTVNLTDADFKLTIKGKAEVNPKDGKKYFSPKTVAVEPVIRKAKINVTNLFPNDPNLEKTANKFLNRNIMFLLRILKQYPVQYVGAEFERVVKIIFDAWPVDELILP